MLGSNRVFQNVPRLHPFARSMGFDDPFEEFEREILSTYPTGNLPLEGSSAADPRREPQHLERLFCDLAPILGMPLLETSVSRVKPADQGQGAGHVAIKPVQGPQEKQLGQPPGALTAYTRAPPVDIVERPKEYIIHVDVPGVQKENIKLQITEDRRGRKLLTVIGERKDDHQQDETQGFRSATALYGPFSRSLRLPKNVATENIVAKCENGVLCITINKLEMKAPEQAQAQEIRVD